QSVFALELMKDRDASWTGVFISKLGAEKPDTTLSFSRDQRHRSPLGDRLSAPSSD
ncbi:hypothetical protein ILYODFUR_030725, partial [Ilyodon furcidens]